MHPNLRRHELVEQRAEQVCERGAPAVVDFLFPVQSSEHIRNFALLTQRRDWDGICLKVSARKRALGASPRLADRSQVVISGLHEPQNELRNDSGCGELSVGEVLVDACFKGHERSVPQCFALSGDRDEKTAGLHSRQMTFLDREVGYKLISLRDESFVNLCTV